MANRQIGQVSPAGLSDAIDIIARAERRTVSGTAAVAGRAGEPASESLPAPNPLATQGLGGVVEAALGPIQLPRLLDLHGAIAHVRDRVAASPDLPEELSHTAIGVLDEETLKIDRYLALSKR